MISKCTFATPTARERKPNPTYRPPVLITAEKKFRSQGHFGSAVIVTAAAAASSTTVGSKEGGNEGLNDSCV